MSFDLPRDWPADPSSANFARYLQSYFSGKASSRPPPFESIGAIGDGDAKKNKCSLAAVRPKIMLNQLVAASIMGGIVKHNAKQRGLLVYHSTGSGKTGTSVALMDSVWDKPDMKIVYVSSVDALASNPPQTFHKLARDLVPRFQGKALDEVARMFERRKVNFLSFAQLAHTLLIANPLKVPSEKRKEYEEFLKGSLLIIDEVHGIFKPLPTQRKEHDALRILLTDVTNPKTLGLRVAIMTATPGDDVNEVISLLNLVRDPQSAVLTRPDAHDAKSMQAFKARVRGLVSYVDMSSDSTRFPQIVSDETYVLPMSMVQFVKYLDAWANDVEKDPSFTLSRKYSNMLFQWTSGMHLDEFSCKLPKLLENVQKYPRQKHYVYSQFGDRRGIGQGVYGIAKFLEQELGYVKLSVEEALRSQGQKGLFGIAAKRRYIMVTSSELAGTSTSKRKADASLSALLRVYNASDNKYGDFVHVLLASNNYYQAMDLTATRHVHFFEPFENRAMEVQAIGRGRRYCSHKELSFDKDWTVSVHRYVSDMPSELKSLPYDSFVKKVDDLQAEIEDAKSRLSALVNERKAVGGTDLESFEYRKNINRVEESINSYKQRLEFLEDALSDVYWKMQARKLRMIDEITTQSAMRRAEELLLVLRAVQQSAADCTVYSTMHGITCDLAP